MKRRFLLGASLLAILVLVLGATAVLAQTGATPTAPSTQQQSEELGVVIVSVDSSGPAAAAGVKRGDILLKFAGQDVNASNELISAVRAKKAGDKVEMVLTHGDEQRTLTATLVDKDGRTYLGVTPYGGRRMIQDFTIPALPDTPVQPPANGFTMPLLQPGAVVMQVVEDSPASAAGLKVGDIISAVDGTKLDEQHNLTALIGSYKPGDAVTLSVTTPGTDQEPREVKVTLGENPDSQGAAFLGVQYNSLPFGRFRFGQDQQGNGQLPFFGDQLPFQLPGLPTTQGAVVEEVVSNSPAATAGLKQGDVITKLDSKAVGQASDLVNGVAAKKVGDKVTLTVQRAGQDEPLKVEVTLGANPKDATKAYMGVSIGDVETKLQENGQGGSGSSLPFGHPRIPFQDSMPSETPA